MAMSHVIAGADGSPARLAVRTLSLSDLKDALAKGVDDFSAAELRGLSLHHLSD